MRRKFITIFEKQFKTPLKIVRMHETHTGVTHTLLFEATKIPCHMSIQRLVADAYGTSPGRIKVDSIEPYERRKDAPIRKPSRESIRKNERFQHFAQ